MKKVKYFLIISLLMISGLVSAQDHMSYVNDRGDKHLIGPIQIADLTTDTTYASWYEKGYASFVLEKPHIDWSRNLNNTQVSIYLGTWCGDSQEWVPQFVKLWDKLGLSRDQLKIIALYDTDEQYKQGPNGEEKGLNIHRVPTFIFEKAGKEYARIVESPGTDLETDVAQIALGYPSAPNYAGANYLLSLFDSLSMDEMYKDINSIYRTTYYKIGKYSELNTLGKVLSTSDRKKEALFVFNFNSNYYSGNWRAQQSYAEILVEFEDYKNAIIAYEKVLKLNPENEKAQLELERLKKLDSD